MAEDTQQATDDPVAQPQDSPVPSEEQQGAEVPQEQPEGLPEEAKERTKREFDKLQTQLREERATRQYYEALIAQQPQPQQTPIVDPNTGYLNEEGLTQLQKETAEAKTRAERAERAIQQMENQQVYQAIPELNPEGEQFDENLHNLTRSIALDSMLNPDSYGGQLSFGQAAQKAKGILGSKAEEIRQQATQQATEQIMSKEQASLDAGGGGRQPSEPDIAALRQVSRGTDEEAKIARIERFKRLQS